jgi:hypothetical protein
MCPSAKGEADSVFVIYVSWPLQAILFYIPRWLWKNWEGGKLQELRMDLNIGFVSKEEKAQQKGMLVDYLDENMNNHTWWAGRYFLCEVLALINVIGAFAIPTPSRMNMWVCAYTYVCTYKETSSHTVKSQQPIQLSTFRKLFIYLKTEFRRLDSASVFRLGDSLVSETLF